MWQKIKNSKIYKNWANLLKALKPMTWKQRAEHLWEYHRYQLIVLFLIVFTLGITVTALQSRNKQVLVGGMMVNVYMEPEGYQYMSGDYQQELGGDGKKKVVDLFPIYFGDPWDPEYGEDSYNTSLVLTARVSGRQLDYMLLDKFAFEYYINQEVYMDLRKVLTEEELKTLEEQKRIIYLREETQEENIPSAVIITETQFAKDNITADGDVYFAFSASSPRLEMCRDVWDRIMAWETPAQ